MRSGGRFCEGNGIIPRVTVGGGIFSFCSDDPNLVSNFLRRPEVTARVLGCVIESCGFSLWGVYTPWGFLTIVAVGRTRQCNVV